MSSDSFVCNLCHQKVKTKLKRAHESSAKHRENVRKLTAPKRPAVIEPEETYEEPVAAKKARPEPTSNEQHSVALRKTEKTIEDDGPSSALPDNFFDSAAKEKAIAANAEMDKEFSKFMNEVEKIEHKEEEIDDKEDAIRKDLEMIDEQIEMWRSLNNIEKQKDQLVANIHSKVITPEVNLPEKEDNDMDDSDGEFDAFGLDWRARKI